MLRRPGPHPPPLPEDAKIIQTVQCPKCLLDQQWILESRMKPSTYELDCQQCGRYLVPTPPGQCMSRSRSPRSHVSDQFTRSSAPSPIRRHSSGRTFQTPPSATRLLLLEVRERKRQKEQQGKHWKKCTSKSFVSDDSVSDDLPVSRLLTQVWRL